MHCDHYIHNRTWQVYVRKKNIWSEYKRKLIFSEMFGQWIYKVEEWSWIFSSSVQSVHLPLMSYLLFKPYIRYLSWLHSLELMHEDMALFHWQTAWNIANISLDRKNNNIWLAANQPLKDSFHFSNGYAFRKLIISFSSANLNFVFYIEIHLTLAEKLDYESLCVKFLISFHCFLWGQTCCYVACSPSLQSTSRRKFESQFWLIRVTN